jgi:hypothetical protein
MDNTTTHSCRGYRTTVEETRMSEMKRSMEIVCMALALCATVCNGGEKSGDPAWTTDWSAFVKQLSVEVTKDNYFVGNVNTAFSCKGVKWSGKVTEIKKPTTPDESGLIRIAMKPEVLKMQSSNPTLDKLTLTPEASEWDSWKAVSVGDTVEFSTTLDEGVFVPKCVLSYMQGMGPNAGKTMAWVNTKGAKCLGVQPKADK